MVLTMQCFIALLTLTIIYALSAHGSTLTVGDQNLFDRAAVRVFLAEAQQNRTLSDVCCVRTDAMVHVMTFMLQDFDTPSQTATFESLEQDLRAVESTQTILWSSFHQIEDYRNLEMGLTFSEFLAVNTPDLCSMNLQTLAGVPSLQSIEKTGHEICTNDAIIVGRFGCITGCFSKCGIKNTNPMTNMSCSQSPLMDADATPDLLKFDCVCAYADQSSCEISDRLDLLLSRYKAHCLDAKGPVSVATFNIRFTVLVPYAQSIGPLNAVLNSRRNRRRQRRRHRRQREYPALDKLLTNLTEQAKTVVMERMNMTGEIGYAEIVGFTNQTNNLGVDVEAQLSMDNTSDADELVKEGLNVVAEDKELEGYKRKGDISVEVVHNPQITKKPKTASPTDTPTSTTTVQPTTDLQTDMPTSTTTVQPTTDLQTDMPTSTTTVQPTTDLQTDMPTSTTTVQPTTDLQTDMPTSTTTVQPTTDLQTDMPTSTTTVQPTTDLQTDMPTSTTTVQPTTDLQTDMPTSTTTVQPTTDLQTDMPTSTTTVQPTTDLQTDMPTSTTTVQPTTVLQTDMPTSTTTVQPTTDLQTDMPTSTITVQPTTDLQTDMPTSTTTVQPTTDLQTDMPTSTTTVQPTTDLQTDMPTSTTTVQPTTDLQTDMPTSTTTVQPTTDLQTDMPTSTTTVQPTSTLQLDTQTTTEEPTSTLPVDTQTTTAQRVEMSTSTTSGQHTSSTIRLATSQATI